MGGWREGVAWALLGVVLFSFSVPLTKVAVEGFDPFLTATGRAAIAGALAVVLVAWRRVPRPPRAQLRPLLVTMLGAVFGWPILLALAGGIAASPSLSPPPRSGSTFALAPAALLTIAAFLVRRAGAQERLLQVGRIVVPLGLAAIAGIDLVAESCHPGIAFVTDAPST